MAQEQQIADPGPLGTAAFALSTFVLSVFNAGLIEAKFEPVYLVLAWFYGGLVQLLAGMWEFKKGNVFGATAFSSYGAFWIALATYVYLATAGGAPLKESLGASSVGIFLLGWTIFTFYVWIATFKINKALVALLTFLLLTFILLDCAEAGWLPNSYAAGWTGIITALIGWYISAAGLLNPLWGRVVLPVGPIVGKASAKARVGEPATATAEAGGE